MIELKELLVGAELRPSWQDLVQVPTTHAYRQSEENSICLADDQVSRQTMKVKDGQIVWPEVQKAFDLNLSRHLGPFLLTCDARLVQGLRAVARPYDLLGSSLLEVYCLLAFRDREAAMTWGPTWIEVASKLYFITTSSSDVLWFLIENRMSI